MVKECAKVLVIENERQRSRVRALAEMPTAIARPYDFEFTDRLSLGLARLDSGDIDLVLIDFSFANSDDLTSVIKSQHRTSKLPIIVLAEKADYETFRRTVKAGAQNCLSKDALTESTLDQAIQQALRGDAFTTAPSGKPAVESAAQVHSHPLVTLPPTPPSLDFVASPEQRNGHHPLNGIALRAVTVADPATSASLAEARYRALLDCARDAIIVTDVNEHVTLWSKGAERIYGWSAAEAMHQTLFKLVHLQGATLKHNDARRHTLEYGEWSGEIRQHTSAGREITVESRWTLVRDAQGEPESFLVINTDVTDRKRIESHLLRAQRMDSIGALAAGIAHDLNNVLAPILMALRPLQQQFTDETSQRWLSVIQKSAERGKDLIAQVQSFAKGTTGEQAPLQLNTIVADIARILRETLPRNIELTITAPDAVPVVIGDTTQLHQMLMNLCLNARDAMPQGGRLQITLENVVLSEQDLLTKAGATPGRFLRVTVSDTGTGIPAEIVDRIFDPFFTTKTQGKRHGLGLSVALGIARSHGGFIDVQTQSAKGSQFNVYLPASNAPAAIAPTAASTGLPNGNGELILVVDDEETLREVVGATLMAAGYDVITAEDGAQALALYEENKEEISVVLTDLMMPNMDGVTAIRKMRELNPNVQVIVTTGVKLSGQHAEAARLGFGIFLAKPYSPEDLLGALAKILGKNSTPA